MNIFNLKVFPATILAVGLTLSALGFAADSALPKKPEVQSQASLSAEPEVNKKTADAAAEKRKHLISDAQTAIVETRKALRALEENKSKEAVNALAIATGKLELVLARNPGLALAPVDMEIVTQDLLSNPDTVKTVIKEAREDLSNGEIQKVRPLIANLASEIQFHTINIPLATYPVAIKAITPLIDAGKIDEAKVGLQITLNTLVITTDVIPLPKLRSEYLIKMAQTLAEKKGRSKEESDQLANDIKGAREQLQMAELLGYGKKKDYKPMYEQLDEIEKKLPAAKAVWAGSTKSRNNYLL